MELFISIKMVTTFKLYTHTFIIKRLHRLKQRKENAFSSISLLPFLKKRKLSLHNHSFLLMNKKV